MVLASTSVAAAPPPPPQPTPLNSEAREGGEHVPAHDSMQPALQEPVLGRLGTSVVQVGAGAAGGFVGVLTGALVGVAACQEEKADWGDLICAIWAGGIGYLVGTPLGVWSAGELLGWDGSFWATLGGVFLGLLVASPLSNQGDAAVVFFLAGPVGGTVGYQLSADARGFNVSTLPKPTMFPLVKFEF